MKYPHIAKEEGWPTAIANDFLSLQVWIHSLKMVFVVCGLTLKIGPWPV